MTEDEIALGTKVFQRYDGLRRLLGSVPDVVSKVYIANDGRQTNLRNKLPINSYTFDIDIIDLEYDAGLGAGRAAIVDRLTESYLTIVDTDHKVPRSVGGLRAILEEESSLGGVGGALVEPDQDRYLIQAQDFKEKDNILIRSSTLNEKDVELVAGYPLVRFHFIPNAAMFRRECLDDYSWDPEYVIGKEHSDFYVGHWKKTDWEFAVCPSVVFEHYPGGEPAYVSERKDPNKLSTSTEYFLEKWNYNEINSLHLYWCIGGQLPNANPSYLEIAGRKVTEGGIIHLLKEFTRFVVKK